MSSFRTVTVITALSVLTILAGNATFRHTIDQELCTQCGECIKNCPVEAISVIREGDVDKHVIDQKLCTRCGECVKNCPVEAIVVTPEEQP